MTAARVEAVWFVNVSAAGVPFAVAENENDAWRAPTAGCGDEVTKVYTPAAVAALMRQMVPEKAVVILPDDIGYNAAIAEIESNIARWEAEKGEGNAQG